MVRSTRRVSFGSEVNAARSETAQLLAEIRNAEMAIRGFCELAAESLVAEGEALHGIESALSILTRARSKAESVLAPDGRALVLEEALGPEESAPRPQSLFGNRNQESEG